MVKWKYIPANKILGCTRSRLVARYEPSRKIELSDAYIDTRRKRAQEHAYMALRAKTLSGRTLSDMECRNVADTALSMKVYLNDAVIEALIGIYRPVSEMFPEGQKYLRTDFFWKRFKYISKLLNDFDIIANDTEHIKSLASNVWYKVNIVMPKIFKEI